MYNWLDVTSRTEKVYTLIESEVRKPLGDQLRRCFVNFFNVSYFIYLKKLNFSYLKTNVWPFLLVVTLIYLILQLLEYLVPRKYIDIAKDFPSTNQIESHEKEQRKKF